MNKRFGTLIISLCVFLSASTAVYASDFWPGNDDGKKKKAANLGTLSYMPVVATVVSK